MFQKLRESLTLVLLALLPFHALLVTVGTRIIRGQGHAPMTLLALWKDGLLGVILVLVMVEVIIVPLVMLRYVPRLATARSGLLSLTSSLLKKFDVLDLLILALIFLGVLVSVLNAVPRGEFLLGAKYDLVPLVAFLILRRTEWSAWFRAALVRVMVAAGSVVALLGIVSLFLPIRFFTFLGYADLHSLYDPSGPLAPFHQIGESWVRRVQSTMSGPNQLGVWLLLPIGMCFSLLSFVWAHHPLPHPFPRGGKGALLQVSESSPPPMGEGQGERAIAWLLSSALVLFIALFLTFSRAAWIAAFVMGVVTLARILPKPTFRKAFVGILGILGILGITVSLLFPSIFFRLSSSRGHLTRPLQAMGVMVRHPLGQGLGSAGPATNRNREPCIFLRPQDDPSWAKAQPQLCVFLGATQVQPKDHACNCPFLPENWYLQVGVELGVMGFLVFLALIVIILRRLGMLNAKCKMQNESSQLIQFCISNFAFLYFLGVSIAALFLHAWEDAAVAYSAWVLAGVGLTNRDTLPSGA